jgi:hypothetical protein
MKGVIVQVGEPKSIVLFNSGKIGAISTPVDCHVGMVVTVRYNNKLKIVILALTAVLLVAAGVFIGVSLSGGKPPGPPPMNAPGFEGQPPDPPHLDAPGFDGQPPGPPRFDDLGEVIIFRHTPYFPPLPFVSYRQTSGYIVIRHYTEVL